MIDQNSKFRNFNESVADLSLQPNSIKEANGNILLALFQ